MEEEGKTVAWRERVGWGDRGQEGWEGRLDIGDNVGVGEKVSEEGERMLEVRRL